MKCKVLVILFGVVILLSVRSFAFTNKLDCKLTMSSSASGKYKSLEFKYETSPEKLEITLSDINSTTPILIGNGGSAKLVKLENPDVIYFIETTDADNLVVYTYFKKTQQILMSKQYLLENFNSGIQLPFGMISSGICKYR